jgi:hypothetical protein
MTDIEWRNPVVPGERLVPRSCLKALAVAAILAVAIGVTFGVGTPGSAFGLLSALAAAAFATANRAVLSGGAGLILKLSLAASAISTMIDPGLLNTSLTWAFTAAIALRKHGDTFGDLGGMALRGLWLSISALPVIAADALNLKDRIPQGSRLRLLRFDLFLLPVLSALILTVLLVAANPLIDQAINSISLDWLMRLLKAHGTGAAFLAFMLIWPLFRVWNGILSIATASLARPAPAWHTRYFAAAPVFLTLVILNVLLGLQNILDLVFMWSGEPLPEGMTYAEYAHRGAYPLIITALLAAAFVLIAFWPGAAAGDVRIIRQLVYLWIAQNVFLVISTIDRTFAYVAVYDMTELRLAALIWMALVAWGLFLVAIRIAGKRNNQWLINANMLSAAVLLVASSFFDHKAYVANYNTATAIRELGNTRHFDRDYLAELGIPALAAVTVLKDAISNAPAGTVSASWLSELPGLTWLEASLQSRYAALQADWRSWSLRRYWNKPPSLPEAKPPLSLPHTER